MKFVTLFLKTENVHLLKDVGMIPYLLYRNHHVDASIATYQNSPSYPYLDKEVQGLKLTFVPKTCFGKIFDGLRYLHAHAKDIDVLNLYHLNLSTYFFEIAYRVWNRHGKLYLKLDMNMIGLKTCLKKNLVGIIKRASIRRADIVSVETILLQKELQAHFGNKIIYITNGCYMPENSLDNCTDCCQKENTLLTVGNLGTPEKATDTLLEAFAESAHTHDWNLKLIGSIDSTFQSYLDNFFIRYPDLKNRICILGSIRDKQLLMKEYQKAKVFTLPSRSESFGIVLVEAASQGCYLITTDMVPAGYDVNGNGRFGVVVPTDDIHALSNAFQTVFHSTVNWNEQAVEIASFAKGAFCWDTIIETLYHSIASSPMVEA